MLTHAMLPIDYRVPPFPCRFSSLCLDREILGRRSCILSTDVVDMI